MASTALTTSAVASSCVVVVGHTHNAYYSIEEIALFLKVTDFVVINGVRLEIPSHPQFVVLKRREFASANEL